MFLLVWLIYAVAISVTAYLLPGITVSSFWSAIITALVLGIINAFIKPIVVLFTLPINILTLGLFTFVINALLILLVAQIVSGFAVQNFWWALLFSLILSIIAGILLKAVNY